MSTWSWRHRSWPKRISHPTSANDRQHYQRPACIWFVKNASAAWKLLSSIHYKLNFTCILHGMSTSATLTHDYPWGSGREVPSSVVSYAPCSTNVDRGLPALCKLHSRVSALSTNIIKTTFGVAFPHRPWPAQKCQRHRRWPACVDFDQHTTLTDIEHDKHTSIWWCQMRAARIVFNIHT